MSDGGDVLSFFKSMKLDKLIRGHERKSSKRAGLLQMRDASRTTAIMTEQGATLLLVATV